MNINVTAMMNNGMTDGEILSSFIDALANDRRAYEAARKAALQAAKEEAKRREAEKRAAEEKKRQEKAKKAEERKNRMTWLEDARLNCIDAYCNWLNALDVIDGDFDKETMEMLYNELENFERVFNHMR